MIPQYIQLKPGLEEAIKENTMPLPSLPLGDDYRSEKFSQIDENILSILISRNRELAREEIRKGEDFFTVMQIADVKFLKKEYSAAEKLYAKTISLNNNYLPAYEKLINTFLINNAVNKKVLNGVEFENFRTRLNTIYKKYIKASNSRPDIVHNYTIFQLSFFLDDKNLADNSINELKKILAIQPTNFAVLDTLGFIYLNLKKDNIKAKDYFKKSLQYNNSHIHSINNLGVVYLYENNLLLAEKQFLHAIEINPIYENAYENLASLYISQRKLPQAISILNRATLNNIKLSYIWRHQYGWLLIQEKNYTKAMKVYLALIQEEPSNSLLYNNLGICYLNTGSRAKAIEYFKKSISIFKQDSKQQYDIRGLLAFYNLARRAIEDDNIALLSQLVKDIQYYDSKNGFATYLLGMISIKQNDFANAKKYFLEALKINSLPDIYISLSFIYSAIERDYKESLKILNEAIEKKLMYNAIYNNLAFTYIKMGDLKSGRKILDIFGENLPIGIMPTKGLLLIREGELAKGITLFDDATKGFTSKNEITVLNQIKNFEIAFYWFHKHNSKKAKEYLDYAKTLGETYMKQEIDELEKMIYPKAYKGKHD